MAVDNAEITELFDRYADPLEIQDANPFRVRAYRNAARVVSAPPRSMSDLVADGPTSTSHRASARVWQPRSKPLST